MKIVFQGDSITDAGRDKRNYHHMGNGYPKYAAEQLTGMFPEVDFEFINQGISGNRTCQLFDRLYLDAIAFEPDMISVLIGINDVWHRYGSGRIETTDEQIETNYRAILTRLRKQTHAKIVMLAPYLLDCEKVDHMRDDLARLLVIVRKLADEFADAYIPLDQLFEEALKTQPEPLYYSGDGVHPNANGSAFIGKHLADTFASLMAKEELIGILRRFAACGWDLIAAPAQAWLAAEEAGGAENALTEALTEAVKQADAQCGSCGCEFDPLYKRALELLQTA